ncbi:MAG: ribbon-helix-helix domain-containing protein [Candidatus Methanofastidiosia archaeon]
MQLVSIQIPEAYIAGIDILVVYGYFPNRSEAIRSAIRDLLEKELGGLKGIRESQLMLNNLGVRESSNEDINEL